MYNGAEQRTFQIVSFVSESGDTYLTRAMHMEIASTAAHSLWPPLHNLGSQPPPDVRNASIVGTASNAQVIPPPRLRTLLKRV